jgi:hypothetical protein
MPGVQPLEVRMTIVGSLGHVGDSDCRGKLRGVVQLKPCVDQIASERGIDILPACGRDLANV